MLGSEIQAGKQLTFKAKQLHLAAAANQQSQQSAQSSSSSAIGVGLNNGDVCAQVRFSESDGNAQDRSCHYTHTRVGGEQGVIFEIEEDVIAKGATVSAANIAGTIGGNLTIESVQDSETHHSEQQSLGVSASVGQHSASVSVNIGGGKLDSTLTTVTEQSGLFAGDQGFRLTVKGHTHLEGAKISSSQAAIDANCNSLTTGSISERAIENHAEYDGHQFNLGFGFSSQHPGKQLPNGVGTTQQGEVASGSQQVPGSGLSSLGGFSAGPPVALRTGDRAHSTTYSGVSGGSLAIQITNPEQQQRLTGRSADAVIAALDATVTSDRDSSNALKPIFDKKKIGAGFAIAGTLAREAGTFLAHRCQEISQKKEQANDLIARAEDVSQALSPSERLILRREAQQLQSQAAEQEKCWGMGGTGRILLNSVALAVGGNVSAGMGQLLQATTVNVIQSYGAQGIKQLADRLESEPTRLALQALLGAGGAAVQGGDVASAAIGAGASVALSNLMNAVYGEERANLNDEERQACRNIITTIISGVAGASGLDAASANSAATIEVENNSVAATAAPVAGGEATLTIAEIAAHLSVAADEVIAMLAATGSGVLTAASVIGIAALPGILYEFGIDRQIQREVDAITKGSRSLEQVIAERGIERARLIELSLMEEKLFSHLDSDEQAQVRHLSHTYLPEVAEWRRNFLQAMWAKYHPEEPLTFRTFSPDFAKPPGGMPKKWGTEEKKRGEPAPQNASEPDDEKKPEPPKGAEWVAFGGQGRKHNRKEHKWKNHGKSTGAADEAPKAAGVPTTGDVPTKVKVLQGGNHTLEDGTARELNRTLGKNAHPNEWGKALEALKEDALKKNDFHGKIWSNGNYTDKAGNVIGNIADYLQ